MEDHKQILQTIVHIPHRNVLHNITLHSYIERESNDDTSVRLKFFTVPDEFELQAGTPERRQLIHEVSLSISGLSSRDFKLQSARTRNLFVTKTNAIHHFAVSEVEFYILSSDCGKLTCILLCVHAHTQ